MIAYGLASRGGEMAYLYFKVPKLCMGMGVHWGECREE